MTMIYVTHDQTEAMTMADRIILMRAGRIAEAGTPDALYGRPQTAFAARFLGTPPMNLLPLGPLRPLLAPDLRAALPGGIGADAQLGIRPEAISLVETGVAALVEAAESLGAATVLPCRVGETAIAAPLPGHPAHRKGRGWG